MDKILYLLLQREAHARPISLTTSEIGRLSGMSQQSASRKLVRLEKDGYIERGRDGIKLTKKAYEEMSALYSTLKAVFEGNRLEIEGTIVKGLGEGGFYVSLPGYRKQFRKKLGFDPFPGTLNIRVEKKDEWKRQRILQDEPVIISGFRKRKRSYGDLFAYRCKLDGKSCAAIFPVRTHHGPDIIEIVCPFNAKKALGKKDGDRVKIVL